jgi:hypothetical protein
VRLRLPIAVLVLAAAAASQPAGAMSSGCTGSLPSAPAGLPAPIVFHTTCGTYRAGVDGAVARVHAVTSPSSPSWPFRIDVRDRHVVLIEHGKVRWRSRRRFAAVVSASDVGWVAVKPHALAFSFIRGRLWVSRLGGEEHAVGWGEGPLTWTKRGDLLTVRRRQRAWLFTSRDATGRNPHVIARGASDFVVDDATQTLLYVSASGSLVRTDGRSKQILANLESLGFDPQATMQVLPGAMIAISSTERLAVLRGDGSVFGAIEYPADPAGLTHGWPMFAVAGDRVAAAVELLRPPPGGTAGEDVYLLRPGDTTGTRLARLQDDSVSCGWLVTLAWRGAWLLYSDSAANVLAIDTDSGAKLDLSTTARRLPGVELDEDSGEYAGLDFAAWSG